MTMILEGLLPVLPPFYTRNSTKLCSRPSPYIFLKKTFFLATLTTLAQVMLQNIERESA